MTNACPSTQDGKTARPRCTSHGRGQADRIPWAAGRVAACPGLGTEEAGSEWRARRQAARKGANPQKGERARRQGNRAKGGRNDPQLIWSTTGGCTRCQRRNASESSRFSANASPARKKYPRSWMKG